MRGIGSDDCVKTGWGRRSFLESLLVAPFTQSSPTLIHSLACDDALDGSPLAWIVDRESEGVVDAGEVLIGDVFAATFSLRPARSPDLTHRAAIISST